MTATTNDINAITAIKPVYDYLLTNRDEILQNTSFEEQQQFHKLITILHAEMWQKMAAVLHANDSTATGLVNHLNQVGHELDNALKGLKTIHTAISLAIQAIQIAIAILARAI